MRDPWVLGVAASQHNGAACLMNGNDIVVAISEERVTRRKRQGISGSRPSAAVAYCLDAARLPTTALDSVVLCTQTGIDRPEHDVRHNPQFTDVLQRGRLHFLSHHLGHALSVLAWSGFEEAAILIADGLGSPWEDLPRAEQKLAGRRSRGTSETISTYRARGWAIEPLRKQFAATSEWLRVRHEGLPHFQSLGGMYGAFAHKIFGDSLEAGKVMGLAPYGKSIVAADRFVSLSASGVRFINDLPAALHALRDGRFDDDAAKMASATVQAALEEALLHLARHLRVESGMNSLCFAGGVALNATANERLLREAGFDRMRVIPAADDGGTAFGAAVHGLMMLGYPLRKAPRDDDGLGRTYGQDDVMDAALKVGGLLWQRARDVAQVAARRISQGEICGWFQGGSEFGPRALGHRSILADPRDATTKVRLDSSIKRREPFRPYAPVTLLSEVDKWFETGPEPASPFMLRVMKVRASMRHKIPAVVHVDGTARVQTVSEKDDAYFRLLQHFGRLTGVPVLLNTSFNAHGEPIVETPADALAQFATSGLDFCVIDDWIFEKEAPAGQTIPANETVS